ncbi:hypothetical protein ACC786_32130 [Rhizobium ruizarguesonis]|uniref:hypothetical protein n=1 Tax=Rhizobium leguminosarum TaxID=384 RepID=UPI00197E7293|nr:hypothetical protein [Rhizobium leguminosarum]
MLLIDRDFKRGGECFAIPSQGEVEGKLAVMEIVSIACLREVVRSKDQAASESPSYAWGRVLLDEADE